ncbi:sulfatase-like hydrolase/transferase, partial [Kibdelosporangium lantanae]
AVAQSSAATGAPVAAGPPNIVFVLTDDLSWNLVQYLPQVQKLQTDGMTFNDYVVTDSLCCPSRSSILTGRFPHDTGVFTNGGNDGGFGYFHGHGEESATFATALQAKGYRTAMMGKYLNGYQPADKLGGTQPYVPPGWSEWDVAGNGYPEFDYNLNENHKVVHYGSDPEDYLTEALDVGNIIAQKMNDLSRVEYEELLRPAFRQDEWKLIAVGAIIGFLVGELQVHLLVH